jgi:ferredoxin
MDQTLNQQKHIKPSTIELFKRHGWRLDRTLHNFVYFYFYVPYVKSALYGTRFITKYLYWFKPMKYISQMIFDRYHAKVLSSDDIKKILTLNKTISLPSDQFKKIIPYKYANKVLFKNPTLIAVMDCPCKINNNAPCRPINACIAIGQDFAPLWVEHCQKYNSRYISQEEALEIIQSLRATGHITQAFLKVATGGLTGVICNCCPKCCVCMESTRLAKKVDPSLSMIAPSGYKTRHHPEKCTYCGECANICPFDAIDVVNGNYIYDEQKCMGCELCVEKCPNQAIELYNPQGYILPLDITPAIEN